MISSYYYSLIKASQLYSQSDKFDFLKNRFNAKSNVKKSFDEIIIIVMISCFNSFLIKASELFSQSDKFDFLKN
jgi:hypothetical protein